MTLLEAAERVVSVWHGHHIDTGAIGDEALAALESAVREHKARRDEAWAEHEASRKLEMEAYRDPA